MLRKGFCSLNIDEATNNANDKNMNILVRFFNEELGKVTTEHLGAFVENQATASNLFNGIEAVHDEAGLEWSKVIGTMMDNCNVMRGQRNGVEALIKQKNTNHLDIHGDTVHIVNNAAKALVKPFDQYVE